MKPSLLQKAAIIPVARCINFYLPGCVNLQVPVTLWKVAPWASAIGGRRCVGLCAPILQRDLIGSRPSCHAGSLAASSSTFSILGGELSKVAALAIKAAAIWPFRCAWRPASSAKASNTPNVEGPNFNANQAVVPDSALASGSALARKSASAASWPGLASRRTNRASLVMLYSFG